MRGALRATEDSDGGKPFREADGYLPRAVSPSLSAPSLAIRWQAVPSTGYFDVVLIADTAKVSRFVQRS
jgi:hypothetical protein